MTPQNKSGIHFVHSDPASVVSFLLPHIRTMNTLVPVRVSTNSAKSDLLRQHGVDVPVDFVPLERPIMPWSDIKALWVLYWRLKRDRPLAVHTTSPKAGLLGMLAAWLARVPVRVHSFTGQVWVTRTGFMRWLLKAADKSIVTMATDVLIDGPTQRAFLIAQGIVTASRCQVLGMGSICGVDTQRFSPSANVRKIVRNELGTASDAFVFLYLGRLNRDKGVLDLASAFARVADKHHKAELWVVGPDEADYFGQMQTLLGSAVVRVKRVGFTSNPEQFMQAADLFCLPSYREGFGSSVIEAAACGVPTLASRIYGLTDAVVEGKTGWMHEPGDVEAMALQLEHLITNPHDCVSRGSAARSYVETFFAERIVTDAMREFFETRLSECQTQKSDG